MSLRLNKDRVEELKAIGNLPKEERNQTVGAW